MASSSSSPAPSHSVASSSSPSWKYDVFLSFRGEDTRKTFVDHLYSALQRQGIITYKDDVTLHRGESIAPSLLKAIEESRIAIIIFSKNYTDSSWCLDEIVHIMKCRDEMEQIVFPIFYNVETSDVSKQEEDFGKAFAKQNRSRVESWREALVGAAKISGWVTKHIANGHEAKCIKVIVDEISCRLNSFVSSGNEDLIGMETRMKDLLSQLRMESRDVRMVGIWGIGGGGKSTLAYLVYKKISHHFDGYCFVENIREESNTFGLKKLQEKVLQDLLKSKEVGAGSIEEGKDMIKSRLCHRRVLIVLDDVDHLDHLRALAGSHNWFGAGSRIIITTRDRHLLHDVDETYHVSLLSIDEATQLFVKHAFHNDKPWQGYVELSSKVVSKVGGLPLALKVLGSFLRGKDLSEWNDALAKLKHIPNTEILKILKISYDGLGHEEKELFLDIACFFKGKRKDASTSIIAGRRESKHTPMDILDACGFHPVIGVKVLIEKALITISNEKFDLHDLVQEMGHYIVQGEHPNNPEKHSRVWQKEAFRNICNGDARMENDSIKAIWIYDKSISVPHQIELVANTNKLRLLQLSSSRPKRLDKVPEFLSNELRWIDWSYYPSSSFPTTFQATKLVGLGLVEGLQKQLWKGYKHLPNLKEIDLSFSNLRRTPDIDGLPCLERMELFECKYLKAIHQSVGRHERLVSLILSSCVNLKMFPPIIRMKKLENLDLSGCKRLNKFPEIRTSMDSLVYLTLGGSGIEVVPSSIKQHCTKVVSLDLSECTSLEQLPRDFKEWSLEELALPPPKRHEPLNMKPFKNLMGCRGLQFSQRDVVVWKFCDLPRFLRKLDLSGIGLVDEDITPDICELRNLRVLDLSRNYFSRLYSKLSKLPQLKTLDISRCRRLLDLPELPSSIAILIANVCDSLEVDGDFPTKYKWLWKVSLDRDANKHGGFDGDKLLHSMLQGNAIESCGRNLSLPGVDIAKVFVPCMVEGKTFTLQLPQNWYNDFNGFLICMLLPHSFRTRSTAVSITLNNKVGEMGVLMDKGYISRLSESPHLTTVVGYVSFSSLSHTTWWNSTHSNTISVSFDGLRYRIYSIYGLGVVPWKNKCDLIETAKVATHCSEFGNEEHEGSKSFEIEYDSKSALKFLLN